MQTKYYLMYRYINPTTNTAITDEADYDKTEEFYNSEHKYYVSKEYLDKLNTNASGTINTNYDLVYKHDISTTEPTLTNNYVAQLKAEADEEREKIITENMANENKSNNLYIYTGTKKYFHRQYIPDQLGYKVRDWKRVPKEQLPSSPEDFSKHFVMIGGTMLGIDDAYLVCKPQYIMNYMYHTSLSLHRKVFVELSTEDKDNLGYYYNSKIYRSEKYYSYDDFASLVNKETFFDWIDPRDKEHISQYGEAAPMPTVRVPATTTDGKQILVTSVYFSGMGTSGPSTTPHGYIFLGNDNGLTGVPSDNGFGPKALSYTTTGAGSVTNYGYDEQAIKNAGYAFYGKTITVKEDNIIRVVIPAHYEDTGRNPYVIKDTYKKIELSPWMLHSVHNSLEHGLDSARKLVSMIGMDNVKMIKYVPFDQFIKIK